MPLCLLLDIKVLRDSTAWNEGAGGYIHLHAAPKGAISLQKVSKKLQPTTLESERF